MEASKLKEHLILIANGVNENTSIEDIYQQLALLADIDESEEQHLRGETVTHQNVIERSKEWLK